MECSFYATTLPKPAEPARQKLEPEFISYATIEQLLTQRQKQYWGPSIAVEIDSNRKIWFLVWPKIEASNWEVRLSLLRASIVAQKLVRNTIKDIKTAER